MSFLAPKKKPAAAEGGAALAEKRRVAEAVRQACLETARRRFETASMDGLCAEGAIEVALDAIRSLDLETIIGGMEEEG